MYVPVPQQRHPVSQETAAGVSTSLWALCQSEGSQGEVISIMDIQNSDTSQNHLRGGVTPLKTNMTGWTISVFNRKYIFKLVGFPLLSGEG